MAHSRSVPRHNAIEQVGDLDAVERERSTAPFEPCQIEEIADDPFEPGRLVADDSQIACPRRFVEDDLGHHQRFKIAAHCRHRRVAVA